MSAKRIKGWHVLAGALAFFGVTIAANAVFVTLALSTFPGVVADEPYVQGLAFNDALAERAHQADAGWTASVSVARSAGGGGPAEIALVIRDAGGDPVRGLEVTGAIGRPATAAHDRVLVFAPSGGSYVAVVDDLADGAWELTMRTALFDGSPFEARKELWLR